MDAIETKQTATDSVQNKKVTETKRIAIDSAQIQINEITEIIKRAAKEGKMSVEITDFDFEFKHISTLTKDISPATIVYFEDSGYTINKGCLDYKSNGILKFEYYLHISWK